MKLPKELQKKYKKKARKRISSNKDGTKKHTSDTGSFQDLRNLLNQQAGKERVFNPAEQQKMMKEIQSTRPIIKANILELIQELQQLLSKYNPIHLLHYICTKHCFTNPETYKESESESMEIWVEYALSCATSIKYQSSLENPQGEVFTRFEELIKSIINLSTQYYMTEGAMDNNETTLKSIRFQFIIRYLGCRGDSFESHHLDLFRQTFQPHDSFLKKHIGFTTTEIVDFVNNIRNEVLINLSPYKDKMDFVVRFQKLAKQIKTSKGDNSETITKEDLIEFERNEEMRALREECWDYIKNLEPFYFKLSPSDKLPRALLELFSIKFGENQLFLKGEKFWPLNDSLIYSKPIIKHEDEFYGFGSTILFRNILDNLELIIREKNQNYYSKTFLKKKAKLLEDMSLNFLRNIMPNASIYGGLFYYLEKDGERIRFETDGLVLFDENLFILEAKAHKLTISARRGSILRIEKTAKQIIDKAYNQGIRCKKYIIENNPAEFLDENNSVVVNIDASDFRSIYIINTTYENLSHLSTQLHSLKYFNFIDGKEWPWTVFINDLRIISEIVESPSIFLLYLQRRIRMNDLELLLSSDELDFFMFFLKTGLYFDDIKISNNQKIGLIGYTDDLDRYYLFLQGSVKEAEKPVFHIPDFYKNIVYNLEKTAKKGFTFATLTLLTLDSQDHKIFSDLITRYKKLSFKTGKEYKMFFSYKKLSYGVLIITGTNSSMKDYTGFKEFLELMIYKYKLRRGIMYKFLFDKESDNIPKIDFEIIEKEWKFNPKLDRMARKYKFEGMKIKK